VDILFVISSADRQARRGFRGRTPVEERISVSKASSSKLNCCLSAAFEEGLDMVGRNE